MITKEQLAQSMTHECDVCLHLYDKMTPASADYRPSAEQRSTLELLRYLSICGIGAITCLDASDWKLWAGFGARASTMEFADFPAAMKLQRAEIAKYLAEVTEEKLATHEAKLPGGGTLMLGHALMNSPLKWLAAYKLQLFLYAKANGATGIGTANAWRGVDAPPRA